MTEDIKGGFDAYCLYTFKPHTMGTEENCSPSAKFFMPLKKRDQTTIEG
jgi:hypothetical protein